MLIRGDKVANGPKFIGLSKFSGMLARHGYETSYWSSVWVCADTAILVQCVDLEFMVNSSLQNSYIIRPIHVVGSKALASNLEASYLKG